MHWVKVEEQAPPIDHSDSIYKQCCISIEVLTLGRFGRRMGRYNHVINEWNLEGVSGGKIPVTHWMEIEEPKD